MEFDAYKWIITFAIALIIMQIDRHSDLIIRLLGRGG